MIKDLAFIIGFASLTIGAGLLSVPAGMISGGAILIGLAIWGQLRNDSR